MAIIDPSQATLLVILYFAYRTWTRGGGWPEAYYRLRGINYFQDYIITESGKIMRPIVKFSAVKHHSPSMWRWKVTGGDYKIGDDNARFANPHNAPAWLHRYDDSRPFPVNKPDTQKCDPSLIANGFDDHSFEELNKTGIHEGFLQQNKSTVLFLLGIVLLLGIDLWYNYNTNCALRTVICR